jgi:hypothetical protein
MTLVDKAPGEDAMVGCRREMTAINFSARLIG